MLPIKIERRRVRGSDANLENGRLILSKTFPTEDLLEDLFRKPPGMVKLGQQQRTVWLQPGWQRTAEHQRWPLTLLDDVDLPAATILDEPVGC
jgi:hypothetical protein